jgi:DNA-binding transcriptional LysR family regulator
MAASPAARCATPRASRAASYTTPRGTTPQINIEVCEIGNAAYEDMLDSGSADLAIGRVSLSDSFRSELLTHTHYVAIRPFCAPQLSHTPDPRIKFTKKLTQHSEIK